MAGEPMMCVDYMQSASVCVRRRRRIGAHFRLERPPPSPQVDFGAVEDPEAETIETPAPSNDPFWLGCWTNYGVETPQQQGDSSSPFAC